MQPPPPVAATPTAEHYRWGNCCDGWYLVKNESLNIIEERMPPGTAELRHRHAKSRQFFYVLSGAASIERDGALTTVKAGEGLEVPPGVAHKVANNSQVPLQLLVTSQPPSHNDRTDLPNLYLCPRASAALRIDGKLGDPAWLAAPWTEAFIDIEGLSTPAPRYRTRAKMLWDDTYLYIAAELEKPDVTATLTAHDSIIFHDNDFEVFLQPPASVPGYFEFEMNALNTGWDLYLDQPYREGGKADNSWEIPGLKSAVAIQGTLNNPKGRDQGWSLELAIPWKAFTSRAPVTPPGINDEWRINFSRVEYLDGNKTPENWVWTPHGVIDMHIPDRWGTIRFVR